MLEELVIRPARVSDLDDLYEMSGIAQTGLTNFPHDEAKLRQFLLQSEHSFAVPEKGKAHFLFVLEHLIEKRVIGVSGIISQIGLTAPAYHYRVEPYRTTSLEIKDFTSYVALHMEAHKNGPTEICTLYLRPEYRRSGVGRFLSLHRFLFMSHNRQFFDDKVIAEMRGLSNKEGLSPFYSAVWEERLKLSFADADRKVLDYPAMVNDMKHKYPIELSLLPHWVRDVVAQPHPKTAPAYGLLSSVGFEYHGRVCALDAGPILEADLSTISVVSSAQKTKDWVIMPDLELDTMRQPCLVLVSNGKCLEYRSGIAAKVGGRIVLTPQLSVQLGVFPGDSLIVSPLYSG